MSILLISRALHHNEEVARTSQYCASVELAHQQAAAWLKKQAKHGAKPQLASLERVSTDLGDRSGNHTYVALDTNAQTLSVQFKVLPTDYPLPVPEGQAAPAWAAVARVNELPGPLQWSGKGVPVPPVGARVHVRLNGIGAGTVTGYYHAEGWLGVVVEADRMPDWYRQANPAANNVAKVFGIDLIPRPEAVAE
jgi:hypothetical protein